MDAKVAQHYRVRTTCPVVRTRLRYCSPILEEIHTYGFLPKSACIFIGSDGCLVEAECYLPDEIQRCIHFATGNYRTDLPYKTDTTPWALLILFYCYHKHYQPCNHERFFRPAPSTAPTQTVQLNSVSMSEYGDNK